MLTGARSALIQATVGGGQRSSSAVAYLEPALERPNLHVLIENTVTRLIQTAPVDGKPTFKKVEFAPNASGTAHALPRRHVIAHATPQRNARP